jgi:hypothetical protein
VALTAAVLGPSLLLALALSALPSEVGWALAREGGPIESATALIFVVGSGVAVWIAGRHRWRSGYAAAVLFLAAGARELEIQRRFTTVSIDRGAGWFLLTSPRVPWPEKVTVGLVLALLVVAAVTLIIREGPALARSLGTRRPSAVAALGAGAALAIAQVFDKTHGAVTRTVPEFVLLWTLVEENLELAGAMLSLLALLAATLEAPARRGAPTYSAGGS